MKANTFNPATDIPSLVGKVILITGGNTGIGKQTALDLSKRSPTQLWISARNTTTGNEALSEIQAAASPKTSVKLLQMDLTSFQSIKDAAKKFTSEVHGDRLDILYLNAGIMGGEPGVTKEGYEKQFGTNHMGHALLLKLLTPLLLKASKERIGNEARVIQLSSTGHKSSQLPPGGIDLSTIKSPQTQYSGAKKYCQSKLANAVYPPAYAERYPTITSIAIHPGEVKTGLFSTGANGGGWIVTFLAYVVAPLVCVSVEEGAKNSLYVGTMEGIKSGEYYEPVGKLQGASTMVTNGKLSKELWKWTEAELEGHEI